MVDFPQPDGAEKMKQCRIPIFTILLKCGLKKVDQSFAFGLIVGWSLLNILYLLAAFDPHKL